jgi:uncharacterized protein with HEPN domain
LPFRDDQTHLRDIIECIDLMEQFLGSMGFEAYQKDLKTKSAVERQIQILTEAARRLGEERGPRYLGTGLAKLLQHGQHNPACLSPRER